MEAPYTGERRRRRMVVVLGALLAVVAASATYYLATRPSASAPPQQRTVVVATVAIPARTLIQEAMVTTIQVPDSPALARVVSDPSLVIGGVSEITINAGDPIIASMVTSGTVGGVNILEPGETIAPDSPIWRAVSLRVPDERAVGGLIVAGDHVDVFATLEIKIYDVDGQLSEGALPPEGYYSGLTTKVTWTNLEVLSVDVEQTLYVLKVDEHQAEEIAHVQGSGANSFTLSLRPEADSRELDRSGYGETTNRILEQYNFPVPQIIDLGTYPQPAPQPSPFR